MAKKKKLSPKKKLTGGASTAHRKKAVKRIAVKKAVKRARPAGRKKRPPPPRLGRPKVTGDEQLYMLFKDDYHARQIFDFLRVQTVRELEEFTPQEIVSRLSAPITQSVERIRQTLAEKNRYLAGDAGYARGYRAGRV